MALVSIVIADPKFGFLTEIFSPEWRNPLQLTLKLMAVSVVIAAVLGICGAWAASSIEGGSRRGGLISRFFLAAMVAAIAMPMILHAAAWEATAGKFGWLPLTQTGSRSTAIGAFGAFGGLLACGWIHGLIGSALVALATWHGVRRVPASVIGQSALDAGPIAVWWRVRLPLAMPWLASSLLATAALAATEMTVVDLYGYRTVADTFYLYHSTEASIGAILVTLFLPLVFVAVVCLLVPIWRRRVAAIASHEEHDVDATEPLGRAWNAVACGVAIALAVTVTAVPIVGLVVKAGHEVIVEDGVRTASWSIGKCVETLLWAPVTFAAEYRWTAIIALSTAVAAVAVAWAPAAVGRTRPGWGRLFDLITLALVLIPGPIVSVLVVRFFQWDVPGFRTAYQQTLVPTMLALLVRSGSVAYWVLRSGYRGIEDRVFEASRLDRPWWSRVWSVDRPLLGRSLVTALIAAAVVASGDVPALLPVIPPGVTTVGTRLFELLHNGARYQEAALALWYVGAVVIIVAAWLRWGAVSRAKLDG